MDDVSKLKLTALPPREAFTSSLSRTEISESQYEHAQKVWDTLGCKCLGDYLKIYNQVDVFLLAGIFERFRELILDVYELDPAKFISLPGVVYNAALKITNI